jgi:hypothetical protein
VDPEAVEISPHLRGDHPASFAPLSLDHAKATFRAPDGVAVHGIPWRSALLTTRVTTSTVDFVRVLHAAKRAGTGRWVVRGAFRLYADDSTDLDRLQGDANEAFAAVLTRFGIRLNGRDGRAWWIPALSVEMPDGFDPSDPVQVVGLAASATGAGASLEQGVVVSTAAVRAVGRRWRPICRGNSLGVASAV